MRLIQRFGRIDRIGSEHLVIYGFNFLPETGIERQLGLKQELRNRIQEIHDSIGEDSAILDKSERLNEEAMYAIYEKEGGQLTLFEDEDEQEFLDINEARKFSVSFARMIPPSTSGSPICETGFARPSRQRTRASMCSARRGDTSSFSG